jgi:hypothetical protein
MMRRLYERMCRIGQGYDDFIERMSSVETLGALITGYQAEGVR